ncbi:MAG: replication initiation factor domain-containing protein [Planctomycetes bacterium]|jgi:hypothetical protein|nr:replication initiation factor domain-containing protein [Planctomycetota bacterium]
MMSGEKERSPAIGSPRATSAQCEASIDWLEFSTKNVPPRDLMAWLEEVLGPAFRAAGMKVESESVRRFVAFGPNGVRVSADLVGSANKDGVREPWSGVCLPGEACRSAGTQRLLALLAKTLPDPGVKVSRMDIALDDFAKGFSPRKFGTTCVGKDLSDENGRLQPCVVTRISPDNWNWDRRKGGCFWLGSVLSDRRLRVYDKERESDGRIRSVRVELQCRNRYATMLARRIVDGRESGESVARCALPFVVAFVDLRQPAGARSSSQEWPRLGWWAEFVGHVQAASTGGEDLSHVLAWERNGKKQGRGMLSVQLRAQGVTPEGYRALRRGGLPEAAVVRAVDAVLDGELTPLSREQEERMRALVQLRGVVGAGNPH